MSAEQQIKLLANYIMAEIPGEPSCGPDRPFGEGAGDTAVRVMKRYRRLFKEILDELGIPGPGYPMPVANAYEIAKDALEGAKYPSEEYMID